MFFTDSPMIRNFYLYTQKTTLVFSASTLDGFGLRTTVLFAFSLGFLFSVFDFLQLEFTGGFTFGFLFGLTFLQGSNIHTTDGTGKFLYTASALKERRKTKDKR